MSLEQALKQRAHNQCELCSASEDLSILPVGPQEQPRVDNHILVCGACKAQIEGAQELNTNHWRCLNDSMWSTEPAVQVMAWRMLKRLSSEVWAQDLWEMLYLDEQTLTWAQAGDDSDKEPTLDSNGTPLSAGDTVVLIKDLDVKGAGFTAKRGTAVRGISLTDNPKHVEGKVNGVRIVLVAEYLKKS